MKKDGMLVCLISLLFVTSIKAIEAEGELPLYMAIVADTQVEKPSVYEFIENSINHLKDRYKDSIDFNYSDLKDPDTWHVTTLYIGNNASKVNTDYFRSFHDDMQFHLPLQTFLYVPGRIMTAPMFFNSFPILIENKHPHITLKTGKWSAVNSNDLLLALFDAGSPIHEAHFVGVFENPKTKLVMRVPGLMVLGEKVDCYIVKVPSDEKILLGQSERIFD